MLHGLELLPGSITFLTAVVFLVLWHLLLSSVLSNSTVHFVEWWLLGSCHFYLPFIHRLLAVMRSRCLWCRIQWHSLLCFVIVVNRLLSYTFIFSSDEWFSSQVQNMAYTYTYFIPDNLQYHSRFSFVYVVAMHVAFSTRTQEPI